MDWVFVTRKGETSVYVGLCGRVYSHPQRLCYCLQDCPPPRQMFQLQMCGPGLHLASASPPMCFTTSPLKTPNTVQMLYLIVRLHGSGNDDTRGLHAIRRLRGLFC